MSNIKKDFLVYKDHLLPYSETFILNQTKYLKKYRPIFIGTRWINELDIKKEKIVVLNKGTLWGFMKEALFKLTLNPMLFNKELSKLNVSFIHAHFGVGGIFSLPIAKKIKCPLIVTFHGFDATTKDEFVKKSFYSHKIYLKKRKLLQSEADLFIAVSNFIKGKMIEQGYPEKKIIVNYIGVDIDYFKPDPKINREKFVLFVGRLVENKGCEYLIRAMNIVQKDYPDFGLVIIGDGPLRGELEKLAKQKLVNYKFLGFQPKEVVRTWMNKAKIFSVPSITIETGASEGFGMVFAEASAMGLPVVSFATGGIPEAVLDGKTGFLVPEKDWKGLSTKIRLLIEDEDLWERFSKAGQKRVKEHFNLKLQTDKLEKIYQHVLDRFYISN